MTGPRLELVEAAAAVQIHYWDTAKRVTRTDVMSLADAEQVILAVLANLTAADVPERVRNEIEADVREKVAEELFEGLCGRLQ